VTVHFVDVPYLSCVLFTVAIDNYKIQATIVVVVAVVCFVFFWSKGHVIFTAGIAVITVISGCDIQTTPVGNSVLYRVVLTH